jgi:hypothetical protein
MQTRETAARQLRTLAGEAWGNVEGDRENATSAALLQLALDMLLDGPEAAWMFALESLSGINDADEYTKRAGEIMAPLLKAKGGKRAS